MCDGRATSGYDVPADHHRVVLMHQVVTVHWIFPRKIAEAQEHLHTLRWAKHIDVFASALVRWHRDGEPIAGAAEAALPGPPLFF